MNPDAEGTLEEIIAAMSDYEYVIEVLANSRIHKNIDVVAVPDTKTNDGMVWTAAGTEIFVHEPVYPDDLYDFSRKQPGMEQELYGFPQC